MGYHNLRITIYKLYQDTLAFPRITRSTQYVILHDKVVILVDTDDLIPIDPHLYRPNKPVKSEIILSTRFETSKSKSSSNKWVKHCGGRYVESYLPEPTYLSTYIYGDTVEFELFRLNDKPNALLPPLRYVIEFLIESKIINADV